MVDSVTPNNPFLAFDNTTLLDTQTRNSHNNFDQLLEGSSQTSQPGSARSHHTWMPYDPLDQGNPSDKYFGQGLHAQTSEIILINAFHDGILSAATCVPAIHLGNSLSTAGDIVVASSTSRSDLDPVSQALELNHEDDTKKPRPLCKVCKKSFSRVGDLRRHIYKHGSGDLKHQCGVEGCAYGGSGRLDKLASHIKNCHLNGKANLGVIEITSWDDSMSKVYCLLGAGDCVLSTDCLGVVTRAHRVRWLKVNIIGFSNSSVRIFLDNVLTPDRTGIRKLTRADVAPLFVGVNQTEKALSEYDKLFTRG